MKVKNESEVIQSCPTPSSLPGSSIHGIVQARVLEWVASAFSKKLVQPLWKQYGSSSEINKYIKMELAYDPAIPLPGICQKELKSGSQKDICKPVFIVALL